MPDMCLSPREDTLKYRGDCYQDSSFFAAFTSGSASEDDDEPCDIASFLSTEVVIEDDDEYVAELANARVQSHGTSDEDEGEEDQKRRTSI
jgi:hypothetical protein